MAFLDNSGDIILDAVLTDTGRMRLAGGDFKVTKYALGDDEINYTLYNSNHTGGIAYYDLEILQTPILESFSNSEASLKSKLISYTNPNLLYLPELILNTNENKTYGDQIRFFPHDPVKKAFLITTTAGSVKAFGNTRGVLNGINPGTNPGNRIRLEFGLNAEGKTPGSLKDREPELNETQFIIECDSRFCEIADTNGRTLSRTFLDESGIATYIVSSTNASNRMNGGIVTEMTQFGSYKDSDQPEMKWLRGAMLQFGVKASTLLQTGLPSSTKSLWAKHGAAYDSGTWDTAATSIGTRLTCGATGQANLLSTRADAGDLYHIVTSIRVTG
jgi:hypothetical protein